jgi:ribosomal protein L29
MKYTDIKMKNDAELAELVATARETLRAERFKDKFSKKAGVISDAKTTIARALTELTARRNQVVK